MSSHPPSIVTIAFPPLQLIGFVVGFVLQNFKATFYSTLAGLVIAAIVSCFIDLVVLNRLFLNVPSLAVVSSALAR